MERAARATTYCNPEWVTRYTAFLYDAGLKTVHQESFVDQGFCSRRVIGQG